MISLRNLQAARAIATVRTQLGFLAVADVSETSLRSAIRDLDGKLESVQLEVAGLPWSPGFHAVPAEMSDAELEALCRVMHEQQGSSDADDPRHHPAQNSWEEPSTKRWQQWEETVTELRAALVARHPTSTTPLDEIVTGTARHPEYTRGYEEGLAEASDAHPATERIGALVVELLAQRGMVRPEQPSVYEDVEKAITALLAEPEHA